MSRPPPKLGDASALGIYSESLTGDFIRILVLEPGSSEDPIICNMCPVPLKDAEDTYEAISYVWGDPENVSSILCNGFSHLITASLALVLRTVRHATKRRTLWADAICINQSDIEEKGQQVKRMGRVYESARRVLVSLGPDDGGIAEDCFDLVKGFNRFWGQQLQLHGELRKVPSKPHYAVISDPKRVKNIEHLFTMPWFDRLWVVQEAGLAKDCVVLWGQAETSFAELVELVLWLHCRADIAQHVRSEAIIKWSDIFLKHQCTLDNKSTWRTNLPLCAWVNNSVASVQENKSFIEVLRTGRNMETSNPHDHVYGFLGSPLALTDEGRKIIEPDYTKSVQEVCFSVACALLHHSQEGVFVFGAVDHYSPSHIIASDGWPSWVPRWDQGHWTTAFAVPYNWYYAGGQNETFAAHTQSDKCLSVKCVVFDKLSWVSKPLLEHDLNVDPKKWAEEFQRCGKSPIGCLWDTVLCSSQHRSNDLEDTFMVTLCREYPSTQEVKENGIQMSFLRSDFAAYRRLMRKAAAALVHPDADMHRHRSGSGRAIRFANKVSACSNRRLAHTESGRMVLTPRFAEADDTCCIFPGTSVPFILRQTKEDSTYHLVGDCYIYGVMRGEIIQQCKEGKYKLETVRLK